jgi:hypothetical protein
VDAVIRDEAFLLREVEKRSVGEPGLVGRLPVGWDWSPGILQVWVGHQKFTG